MDAHDPATGELLGSVRETPPEEIDAVVAGVAKVQPLWALLRVRDRARYMRKIAQAIVDEFDTLADAIAREQGRPRAEVATLELLAAIDALIWIADEGADVLGGRRVATHRSLALAKRARIVHEPYGVIGVIGAGSAPFAQPLGQIAGALLAGNAVVFKPARRACLAGEAIASVVAKAGLPEGLVALAHGGAQAGVALARSPVDKVLFTGSPAVGRAVARECVSRETEVTVELGGKDAMLVLADADLAKAVDGALWAGCAGAGQARGAVERIYVVREVSEPFVQMLIAGARALSVGNPRERAPGGSSGGGSDGLARARAGAQGDPSAPSAQDGPSAQDSRPAQPEDRPRPAQVGPLASERRLEHVRALVDEAVAQGAELRCGGPIAAPPGCKGAFYAPAVITGATPAMRLMREPLDGPVLAVVTVADVEEAIALANDCEYGLGASVWTADRYRGIRIAHELRAGMVWLNDHLPGPTIARGPWGPAAGGGLGKTLGESGLRACAQEKLIAWSPAGLRGLWWGPYDEATVRAARTLARMRSTRDGERGRAWRDGAPVLARVGARVLGRGVPR